MFWHQWLHRPSKNPPVNSSAFRTKTMKRYPFKVYEGILQWCHKCQGHYQHMKMQCRHGYLSTFGGHLHFNQHHLCCLLMMKRLQGLALNPEACHFKHICSMAAQGSTQERLSTDSALEYHPSRLNCHCFLVARTLQTTERTLGRWECVGGDGDIKHFFCFEQYQSFENSFTHGEIKVHISEVCATLPSVGSLSSTCLLCCALLFPVYLKRTFAVKCCFFGFLLYCVLLFFPFFQTVLPFFGI